MTRIATTLALILTIALCGPAFPASGVRPLEVPSSQGQRAPAPQASVDPTFDAERVFDKRWSDLFSAPYDVRMLMVQASVADMDAVGNPDLAKHVTAPDPVCGCPFEPSGLLTDPTHCPGVRPGAPESDAAVASVSVMNDRALAEPLACYRRGRCMIDGVQFGGVTCCEHDPDYYLPSRRDGHFYVLMPRNVADALRGLQLGGVTPGSPKVCGVSVDRDRGTFSLPAALDGLVARAWVYAARHYGTVPPSPLASLQAVSDASPPGRFEIARERILRYRFKAPMASLDAAIAASAPSAGLRIIGVRR